MITVFIVQDISGTIKGVYGDRTDAEREAIKLACNGASVTPKMMHPILHRLGKEVIVYYHPSGGEYCVSAHKIN